MKDFNLNSHDKYRLKKIKILIQIAKFNGLQNKLPNAFNNNATEAIENFRPNSIFVAKYKNYKILKKQICVLKDWNDYPEKYSYSYKTNSFVSNITNKTKRHFERTTKIILNFKNKKQKSSNNSWRSKKEVQIKQFQICNQSSNKLKNKPLQASMNFSNFHSTLQRNKKLEPLACEDAFKLLKSQFFPKIIPTSNRSAPKFKLTIKEIYRTYNKYKADGDLKPTQKTRIKTDTSKFPKLPIIPSTFQLKERFQTDKTKPCSLRKHNNQNFQTILTFKSTNSTNTNLEQKNLNDRSIQDQDNIIKNIDGTLAEKVVKTDVSLLKLENKVLENSVVVNENETVYFTQNPDGNLVEYLFADKNMFSENSFADIKTFIKNKDGSFSEAILQNKDAEIRQSENKVLENQIDVTKNETVYFIQNPDGELVEYSPIVKNMFSDNSLADIKTFIKNKDGSFSEVITLSKGAEPRQLENEYLGDAKAGHIKNEDGGFRELNLKNKQNQFNLSERTIENLPGKNMKTPTPLGHDSINNDGTLREVNSEIRPDKYISENPLEGNIKNTEPADVYIKNDDGTFKEIKSDQNGLVNNEYLGDAKAGHIKNEDGGFRDLNLKNKQNQFNLSERTIENLPVKNMKTPTPLGHDSINNDGTLREVNSEIRRDKYISENPLEGNIKNTEPADVYIKNDDGTFKEIKSDQNGLVNNKNEFDGSLKSIEPTYANLLSNDGIHKEINYDQLNLVTPANENMKGITVTDSCIRSDNLAFKENTFQTTNDKDESSYNKNDRNMKNRAQIYPFVRSDNETCSEINSKNKIDSANLLGKNMGGIISTSVSYFKNEDRTIKEINFEYKPDQFNSVNLIEGNMESMIWSDDLGRYYDGTFKEVKTSNQYNSKTIADGNIKSITPAETYVKYDDGTLREINSESIPDHQDLLTIKESNAKGLALTNAYVKKDDWTFRGINFGKNTDDNGRPDKKTIAEEDMTSITPTEKYVKYDDETLREINSENKTDQDDLLAIVERNVKDLAPINEHIKNDDGTFREIIFGKKTDDNGTSDKKSLLNETNKYGHPIATYIRNESGTFTEVLTEKKHKNILKENRILDKENIITKESINTYKNEDGTFLENLSPTKSNDNYLLEKKKLENPASLIKNVKFEDETLSEMFANNEQINVVKENVENLEKAPDFIVNKNEESSNITQGFDKSNYTEIENNDFQKEKIEYEFIKDSDILEMAVSSQNVQNQLSENEVLLYNFKASAEDINYILYNKDEEITSSNVTSENIQLYKEIQESQSIQNANENQIYWTSIEKIPDKPIIISESTSDNMNIGNRNIKDMDKVQKLSTDKDSHQETLIKRISFTRYEHKFSGFHSQQSGNEFENQHKGSILISEPDKIKMNANFDAQLNKKDVEKTISNDEENNECVLKRLSIQYSDPKLSGTFRAPSNEGEYFGGENMKKNSFKENDADIPSKKDNTGKHFENTSYIKKFIESSHDSEPESQGSKVFTGTTDSTELASFYGSGAQLFRPEHSPYNPVDNIKNQKFPIFENSKETKTDISFEDNDYYSVNTKPSGFLTDQSSSASFYGSGSLDEVKKDFQNIEKNTNDYLFTVNSHGLESLTIKTVDIRADNITTHSPIYETDNFDIDQIASIDTFQIPRFEKILFEEKNITEPTVLSSINGVKSIQPINVSLMQSLLPENALDMRPPNNPPDSIETIEVETIKSTNVFDPNRYENMVQVIENTMEVLVTESPDVSDFYDAEPCSDVSLSLIQRNQLTCQSNVNQNNEYFEKSLKEIEISGAPSKFYIITKRKYFLPIEKYKKINNRFLMNEIIISISKNVLFPNMSQIRFPLNNLHNLTEVRTWITKKFTSDYEHIIDRRKSQKINHSEMERKPPETCHKLFIQINNYI